MPGLRKKTQVDSGSWRAHSGTQTGEQPGSAKRKRDQGVLSFQETCFKNQGGVTGSDCTILMEILPLHYFQILSSSELQFIHLLEVPHVLALVEERLCCFISQLVASRQLSLPCPTFLLHEHQRCVKLGSWCLTQWSLWLFSLKVWQYITLMRRIFLIDCPGVVYPSEDSETDIVLKGVVSILVLLGSLSFLGKYSVGNAEYLCFLLFQKAVWSQPFWSNFRNMLPNRAASPFHLSLFEEVVEPWAYLFSVIPQKSL